jgi:formiminotetrahydrofolate cyclodeaminase
MALDEVQESVAAARPAPAGVAVACIAAALAVSLIGKVLRITGKRPELLLPVDRVIADLRTTADADCAAIETYMQTRDRTALSEVPRKAAALIAEGSELCAGAAESVTGLIAADLAGAAALLDGAARAVAACR